MYDTIIIGGGISGLACGKTLHDHDKDFLLLTKDVGGRMLTSKSHTVDYGASYITSDYKNVLPYMGGRERIKISDCYFMDKNKFTTFYCLRVFYELPKLIKLYFITRDFRKRLNKLRNRALYEQQKKIIDSDPILKGYTKKSAKEFIKEHNLEYLNDTFFNPLFNSTGFVEYDKSNVFFYLDNLMAVICKTYVADHSHCCSLLTHGWKDKLKKTIVHALSKSRKGGYLVKTSHGTYHAKNVVIAVPYKDTKQFYDAPKPKYNVPIYVFHIAGKRKEAYQNKDIIFFKPKEYDITIIWKQLSGSDIIFSKIANPKLKQYYRYYHLIKRIYWKTAAVLSGEKWVKQNLDKGLYLASDYNICGLEDAFITGVYAANQIIGKKP